MYYFLDIKNVKFNFCRFILFCFFIFAWFFIFSQSVLAATCIPGAGELNLISVSVSGTDLTVIGVLDAGECTNTCFDLGFGDGEFAVPDPVSEIRYRIDSGVWTSLIRGFSEQWDLDVPAQPTNCTQPPVSYTWAQYSINTAASPISVAGYVGTHIIAIEAYIDNQIIAVASAEFIVNPPEIPTLIAPPHNTWINYLPTFQAEVFDLDEGDTVAAVFEVSGYNAGGTVGSFLSDNGPGISSWGLVAIDDGDWWWRAWGIDSNNIEGPETGYWLMRKDTQNPTASIDQENGISQDLNIWVNLRDEFDSLSGIAEGNVDVRINGGNWVDTGLPNSGNIVDDFIFSGVDGNAYEFRYQVRDVAGNWSGFYTDGSVTVNLNNPPAATNLNRVAPDFCSVSPAYFFSWIYSDSDLNNQSRFDFQIDDSGIGFPSPEIDRSYSGLSNPSPTTNNQAVIVLLSEQADYLTYGRTYNWRIRVYDENNLSSGWVSGAFFTTPSHHFPVCDFVWSPTNPKPEETISFTDSSICYNAGGSVTPCVNWSWTFSDANPANSFLQNPDTWFLSSGVKDIVLTVADSFGSQCSITKQVIVNLLPSNWREIRPW